MLLSSNFEPTIENAPCPPFFVEDVYDIFISTAANNNLTANVTVEVWNKCMLQYSYPTTTTTITTEATTTTSPTTLTLLSKCDTVCLSMALMFSVCVFLGILITLIYCNIRHRRKKHVIKHSNRPKRKISYGKYIPKFPKMSKQADLKKTPLAYINPSFLTEHEHMSHPFDYYSAQYQPIDNMYPWYQPQNELFSSGGRQFHPYEKRNHQYSYMGGSPSRSAEFTNRRSRHPSIGSYVPKMLPESAEIYPFGIEVYDTTSRNSGLSKIDIDYKNADKGKDAVIREHKLPRIPFENDFSSNSPYSRIDTRQDHPDENNEEHKRDNSAFILGLPRIPLVLEQTGGELSEKPSWQLGLPKPQVDKRYSRETKHEENYFRHPKHGLPRTPFEASDIGNGLYELNKQNRRQDDSVDHERQNIKDNGKLKSNAYSLYQGKKDSDVCKVIKSESHAKECDPSDKSFSYSVPYTKL
ncbi:uncharacterized protein LOC132737207 [Ruditapes philippinarum]|uniref:uncharacterized protein LOC132737207 n=1 Tax=Ruditapes philippinarum TaxID=129788 RepID=UPI00295AB8D3|nr:uncharacterized protein LOC132737207 [Ruditapes philippinarum]